MSKEELCDITTNIKMLHEEATKGDGERMVREIKGKPGE